VDTTSPETLSHPPDEPHIPQNEPNVPQNEPNVAQQAPYIAANELLLGRSERDEQGAGALHESRVEEERFDRANASRVQECVTSPQAQELGAPQTPNEPYFPHNEPNVPQNELYTAQKEPPLGFVEIGACVAEGLDAASSGGGEAANITTCTTTKVHVPGTPQQEPDVPRTESSHGGIIVYIYVYIYMYIYKYHIYTLIYLQIQNHLMEVCMYMHIYVSIYFFIYIHIHILIHIYIHDDIYIYT